MFKASTAAVLLGAVWLTAQAPPAAAWSQEGHMVTGAITYEELHARDPAVVRKIVQLLAEHPDRGAFSVALSGAAGDERARRLFMEMARWPDDIRGGVYDHPTWHYSSRPLADARHPSSTAPGATVAGSAIEAFALNVSVAGDVRAPAAERAVALCWMFHLVGDMHQPLHAADGYSLAYPDGDHGGGRRYILDPQSHQPLSLHWYWDQAVNRSVDAAPARAAELRSQLPRAVFAELKPVASVTFDFKAWAAESYALAKTQVYTDDLTTGIDESRATPLPAAYVANSIVIAEHRLTLASYRLADLLAAIILP